MNNAMTASLALQRGLSLVELMIAMVLGLVLTAGISQLFIGNKQATEITRNLGFMQENIRMTSHFLDSSIHMAGQFGGIRDMRDISGTVSITGLGGCNSNWAQNLSQTVMGYNGATAVGSITGLPAGCLSNYVSGSDILLVRYADSSMSVIDANLAGDKAFLRVSIIPDTGYRGMLFKAGDGAPSSMPQQISTYNMPLHVDMYYLKSCSRENAARACQDNIPSLARISLNGLNIIDQVLVEGVEQFQLEYGQDANADGTVEAYAAANNVTDWSTVKSVRYGLVVRAEQPDPAHTDGKSYTLSADTTYTPVVADRDLYRKLVTKTIQMKNSL